MHVSDTGHLSDQQQGEARLFQRRRARPQNTGKKSKQRLADGVWVLHGKHFRVLDTRFVVIAIM